MIVAGKVAADTITYLKQFVQPGITTLELDQKVKNCIESYHCTPAFLNYMKFPNSACISVNEEVVHCLPSSRVLKEGDIVTLDLGAKYDGLNSDTAYTFTVGTPTMEVQKFLTIGYQALLAGIKQVKPGNYVGDISEAVEKVIRSGNYGIVKNFVGHGIGRKVHEGPQIPNFSHKNKGPMLTEGMVICIEPILTMDPSGEVKCLDRWNTKTAHNTLACHFEHTIMIGSSGPKILTKRIEETI